MKTKLKETEKKLEKYFGKKIKKFGSYEWEIVSKNKIVSFDEVFLNKYWDNINLDVFFSENHDNFPSEGFLRKKTVKSGHEYFKNVFFIENKNQSIPLSKLFKLRRFSENFLEEYLTEDTVNDIFYFQKVGENFIQKALKDIEKKEKLHLIDWNDLLEKQGVPEKIIDEYFDYFDSKKILSSYNFSEEFIEKRFIENFSYSLIYKNQKVSERFFRKHFDNALKYEENKDFIINFLRKSDVLNVDLFKFVEKKGFMFKNYSEQINRILYFSSSLDKDVIDFLAERKLINSLNFSYLLKNTFLDVEKWIELVRYVYENYAKTDISNMVFDYKTGLQRFVYRLNYKNFHLLKNSFFILNEIVKDDPNLKKVITDKVEKIFTEKEIYKEFYLKQVPAKLPLYAKKQIALSVILNDLEYMSEVLDINKEKILAKFLNGKGIPINAGRKKD